MQRQTPNKQAILERARELWFNDRSTKQGTKSICITPEYEELLESGYIYSAQCELMRDTDQYKTYLAEELSENVEEFKAKPQAFDFDLNEALNSGVFIAGGKQCGKTNLAKALADLFIKHGCIVKVFDISQQWQNSSVPYTIKVDSQYLETPLYKSVVFDLSKLYVRQIKAFITQVLKRDFASQVATPKHKRKWIVYVLEECQILIPQGKLRSLEAQEVLRLLTSGANYNLSYVAITQRPSTVDTTVMELAYQKYFARCDGENDKRKIKTYIEDYAEMLDSLKLGQFIYDMGDTTKKIATKRFTSTTKPRRLEIPSMPTPLITMKPQKIENTKALVSLIVALMWFIAIVLALTQLR